jgi:hypothetical protein
VIVDVPWDSSFCRQIPPSPRKSRSFPVTIISRFAAYNAQSEGAFIHMPYENRGLNEKMGEKMVPGNRSKGL